MAVVLLVSLILIFHTVEHALSLAHERVVGIAQCAMFLHSLCSCIELGSGVAIPRRRSRRLSVILGDGSLKSRLVRTSVTYCGVVGQNSLGIIQGRCQKLFLYYTTLIGDVGYFHIAENHLKPCTATTVGIGHRTPLHDVVAAVGRTISEGDSSRTYDGILAAIEIWLGSVDTCNNARAIGINQFKFHIRSILPSSDIVADLIFLT